MKRVFDEPSDFLAWLKTRSRGLAEDVCKSIDEMIDRGIDGKVAAHIAYDLVEMADRHKAEVDEIYKYREMTLGKPASNKIN